MAFRTWLKLLLATIGVAALAGASQLGMAYGLGIVRLARVLDVTTRDQWTAQLAWVAWFAMMAAVVGALAGSWLLPRWNPALRPPPVPAEPVSPGPSGAGTWPTSVNAPRRPEPPTLGAGTMIALAVAAAVGAGVVAPLTMQPARTAQIAGVNAVVVIGICAGLGAIVGLFAAYAALAHAVARWNLATVAITVWIVALISVSPSLAISPARASTDLLPAIRLGVFDAGFLSPATTQRTALFTMPAIALLAGAVIGWRARQQERPTLTIALAGLPGAALLTLAYLIAGPGAGADRYQVVPYWAAMTAAGAGVLGSVLAAVLRRTPSADDDSDDPAPGRPLPQSADKPEPAAAATPASSAPATATSSFGSADQQAGRSRASDSTAFDTPSGQMRSAPSGQNPLAAPWSPALSRGLRSLARSRPSGTAPVALPLPAAHDRPDSAATGSQPEPKRGRRSRRGPLVPEPEAISAPLPQPTPIALPPWQHEPTQAHATAYGSQSDTAGQDADGKKGRRFGLKKREENNDYVDWVSGLGND